MQEETKKEECAAPWSIEVVNATAPRGNFHYAIFDFDGTLSLIREGWQKVMVPYFADELAATPRGKDLPHEQLAEHARDFIYKLTGKQTIYQCIQLAQEVEQMGGKPLEPQAYKDEYHRRLMERIAWRVEGLKTGREKPENHIVPGVYGFLEELKKRGLSLYLASGTDDVYVQQEVRLLHLDPYFTPHIYGAQRDYKTFSKKMVIDRIIRENELHGPELIGFGDGYVEIEDVKSVGGFACGVATDEVRRKGVDEWKRNRLMRSGADIIIPDFTETKQLVNFLFKE